MKRPLHSLLLKTRKFLKANTKLKEQKSSPTYILQEFNLNKNWKGFFLDELRDPKYKYYLVGEFKEEIAHKISQLLKEGVDLE